MLQVTAPRSGERFGRALSTTLLTYSTPHVPGFRQPARAAISFARPEARSPAEGARPQLELRGYLLYLAVAFLLAVALSWSNSTTARLGYRIDELKAEITALRGENEKLGFELSGLQSASRIEREATERLGMVRPDYVRVSSTFGPATGSPGSETREEALAWVIRLGPSGSRPAAGDGQVASVTMANGGPNLIGSLWDRFYRWLTGISEAKARDRH